MRKNTKKSDGDEVEKEFITTRNPAEKRCTIFLEIRIFTSPMTKEFPKTVLLKLQRVSHKNSCTNLSQLAIGLSQTFLVTKQSLPTFFKTLFWLCAFLSVGRTVRLASFQHQLFQSRNSFPVTS